VIHDFSSCITQVEQPETEEERRAAASDSRGFAQWLREYSPFPLYRSH
jgi:hypothetical protein